MSLALALALQEATPEPQDIVVRAVRQKCRIEIADRILSDRDFLAHADEWAAGRPLHIVVSSRASYKCLAKIVFKLNKKGVKLVYFDDAPVPAAPR